jgi:predicted peptidase
MMKAMILSLGVVVGLVQLSVGGGGSKTGFIDLAYKGSEGEGKYVVFVPQDYKGDKAYPLILFLHGLGESGTDGVKQTKVGLGPAIKKKEKTFPFFAVFPQSQKRTWAANSEDGKRALAILAEVQKNYKIDSKRIYLTGLSMGGFGTWSLAATYPERWAAIAPICGGIFFSKDAKINKSEKIKQIAEKIKDIPCWCFHGGADKVVLPQRSQEIIATVKDAGGMPVYTEYDGVAHNSWDRAYGTAKLYDWFLKHKLK